MGSESLGHSTDTRSMGADPHPCSLRAASPKCTAWETCRCRLCGESSWNSMPESWPCCSDPRGAANRRCSTSSVASISRPPGAVHFRDQDLFAADDEALTRYRREHVGFVFQFYNLIPSLTARENVELVTDMAEHKLRAEEALELVGLAARMDHFRPSCLAESSSAWPSRAPWPSSPACSCVMSPPVRSTSPPASWCST
jgi:hypothetical protein